MNLNLLFKNYANSEAKLTLKKFFSRLSYFAFQFVNDQQIAEDLVQDSREKRLEVFWKKE